jgi:hypothetical protein
LLNEISWFNMDIIKWCKYLGNISACRIDFFLSQIRFCFSINKQRRNVSSSPKKLLPRPPKLLWFSSYISTFFVCHISQIYILKPWRHLELALVFLLYRMYHFFMCSSSNLYIFSIYSASGSLSFFFSPVYFNWLHINVVLIFHCTLLKYLSRLLFSFSPIWYLVNCHKNEKWRCDDANIFCVRLLLTFVVIIMSFFGTEKHKILPNIFLNE